MMPTADDEFLLNSFCLFDKNIVEKCFQGILLWKSVAGNTIISAMEGNQKALEATQFLDGLVVSVKMSCSTCGVSFGSRQEQVLHYKLQWHCNNLKRKIDGKTAMDEKTYDESSKNEINESDSSDSCYEDEEEKESSRIVEIKLKPKQLEMIFFQNESGYLFSVYKCILISKQDTENNSQDLSSRIEQLPNCVNWAVILMGGGHFAAAIFKGQEVVAHKTFHRYTVRAKQGSSQSSHDSSRHASSGGASLRRYNETALIEETQTLLKGWNSELEACEFVFFRAPGANRKTLIGGKQPPFVKDDQRLRNIPFHIGRPTFKEVVRVQRTLSTVECYGNLITDEVSLEALSEIKPKENVKDTEDKTTDDQVSNLKTTRRRRTKKTGKQHQEMSTNSRETSEDDECEEVVLEMSDEERDFSELREFEVKPNLRKQSKAKHEKSQVKGTQLHKEDDFKKTYDKLYTACKLGKLEMFEETLRLAAKGFDFAKKTFGQMNSTLLHVAAQGGFDRLVVFLLDVGGDPTLKDVMGRPPYCVASNKETRNAFRRFMAKYPDKYDYQLAQIPSPLCEEAEKAKAEQRSQKTQEKKMEAKKKTDFLMSTQTEKKAAFASGTVRCWFCGNALDGKIPFEYNDFKFCKIGCLKNHRTKNKT